jgi:hypothetical protein
LFEEDGRLDPEIKTVRLVWDNKTQKGHVVREGKSSSQLYSVINWKFID